MVDRGETAFSEENGPYAETAPPIKQARWLGRPVESGQQSKVLDPLTRGAPRTAKQQEPSWLLRLMPQK